MRLMDPYDSHHAPGHDRLPESSTPIYDRLLAEWRDAARREAGPGPVEASSGPRGSRGSARGRKGAFVPAARAEEGRG
ncbi:hypothetical protein ACFTXO_36015 [Streptomyces sp. NPDC057067]